MFLCQKNVHDVIGASPKVMHKLTGTLNKQVELLLATSARLATMQGVTTVNWKNVSTAVELVWPAGLEPLDLDVLPSKVKAAKKEEEEEGSASAAAATHPALTMCTRVSAYFKQLEQRSSEDSRFLVESATRHLLNFLKAKLVEASGGERIELQHLEDVLSHELKTAIGMTIKIEIADAPAPAPRKRTEAKEEQQVAHEEVDPAPAPKATRRKKAAAVAPIAAAAPAATSPTKAKKQPRKRKTPGSE